MERGKDQGVRERLLGNLRLPQRRHLEFPNLIAKGIKTEVFGAKVAEAIRDREFKRLELANGLAGCAPEVRGKGELVLESGDRYPALLMNHIPGRSLSKALDILQEPKGEG